MTLFAGEGPRLVVDQLAREPEALAASLAVAMEGAGSPRVRLAWDAMLVVGPEHGRVFREAGWSRERLQEELFTRTHSPAGSLVRGAGGIAEGLAPEWVSDPDDAGGEVPGRRPHPDRLRRRRRRAVLDGDRRLGVGRRRLGPANR